MLMLSTIIIVISTLGWAFLTTGFKEYRRKEWLTLWTLTAVIMVLLYLFTTRTDGLIPEALRMPLNKLSLFWVVTQFVLVAFFPVWFAVALGRWLYGRKGAEKEGLWRKVGWAILGISVITSAKAIYFPDPWRVVPIEIVSEEVPPALVGMKIAQITDTHISYPWQLARLKDQVEKAAAEKADILIFTGDLADNVQIIAATTQIFKDAEGKFPLGVWFLLGNHEYIRGVDKFLEVYKEKNVHLLRNTGVTLEYKGTSFYLAGVDYPFSKDLRGGRGITQGGASSDPVQAVEDLKESLKDRKPGEFTILAAHHPVIFDEAFNQGITLSFAGHTHAYQVGLNGRSANVFMKYAWGLYGNSKGYGYVSSGSGEWLPVRIGVPEEVVIFTLKRP